MRIYKVELLQEWIIPKIIIGDFKESEFLTRPDGKKIGCLSKIF